jgi:fibronectin type III domain protein/type IX secretion system substrate protein
LKFNVGGIDDDATVTGCSIQFASGVPTDPAGNGTLKFRKLRWDFASIANDVVYKLILKGSLLNSKAITTQSTYTVTLNSYVQDIQNAYQTGYPYIGLGINNYYEAYKGTSFTNSKLIVYYTIPTPPAPTNLRTTPTATTLNFAWDASTGDITGYKISVDGDYYNTTASTSILISNLSPGTSYNLYIIPYNGYGDGVQSSTLSASTASYSITNSSSGLVCSSPNSTFTFSDNENFDCSIQIIDYYGSLHYQATKSGDNFTIPVSNLKNGNYFVKITNGKKTFNLKLVVKH